MECLLLVPSVAGTEWMNELFPGWSLAEIPVAGRHLVSYSLEMAQKAKFTLVEVLDWNYSSHLEGHFNDPTSTGTVVFYSKGTGPLPRGLDDLAAQSTPLTQDISDGITVTWGPCLPLELEGFATEQVTPEECACTPLGFYRREGGRWLRIKPRHLAVRDLKSWHDMNFSVLHDPGMFTLPGYSAEKGVYLGRNVVLEHGAEVKAPVLLKDNTWFARNVRLDGDVIVGTGSFVSEGARLKRTVVGRDTFIGAGLDIEGKIVIGHRIFDIDTGAWADIEDPGVVRWIGGGLGIFRSVWHFLRGHSYGRRG